MMPCYEMRWNGEEREGQRDSEISYESLNKR
jgi:hypothetical protein